ncbi:Hypothetical protein POVR2_LOCUS300 [uncultured virus]|nr:Hypothetical protein POVR2_LOCUS300 [uncultured virus]
MGISFSQQISRDITNGYLEVINQLTASATTTLNNNTAVINQLNLSTCGIIECGRPCQITGDVTTNQRNQATAILNATTIQQISNSVKNSIQDTTTQYVKSLNQVQQSWLAIAFGINVQDQSTINNFSEKISNLISNTAATTCSAQLILANNANLSFCNVTGNINTVQRNDVLAAQSCISKQIVSNIINNKELFDGMQVADQANYSDQGGPLDFLYYIGLLILFIIIVVTIAGVIRYATRGPKQPKTVIVDATSLNPAASNVPTVTPVASTP